MNKTNYQFLRDPLCLSRVLWPDVRYYDKQREIIYSVWHNKETICVAGNMLGKDFVAGRIALMFFLTRTPCRVVTTSVDHTQLEGVLWGEIRSAIQTSKMPLLSKDGGPLLYNHLHIRKVWTYGALKGQIEGLSYMMGIQARDAEKMAGHHIAETGDEIPRTLFVGDEASGLDDVFIDRAETWYDRSLLVGNPYPCQNRFYRGSESGDLLSQRNVLYWEGINLYQDNDTTHPIHYNPNETVEERDKRIEANRAKSEETKQRRDAKPKPKRVQQYTRKVIHISCDDSPNVRLGKALVQRKLDPSDEKDGGILVPGVMSYWKYKEREQLWDDVKKCIQLYGRFYKGAELLLFPPDWLNRSEQLEFDLFRKRRIAKAIGCDPGEGTAETAWYVVDDYGIMDEVAIKTPDTSIIDGQTIALARKWNIPFEAVMFDAGGGGKQIADRMRASGYNVQTVAFGESVTPKPKRGMTTIERTIMQREEKYAYLNRRAHMYGHLSELLEPRLDTATGYLTDYPTAGERFSSLNGSSEQSLDSRDAKPRFCIPARYTELRRQLALIPKVLDKEGRLKLPPKNRPAGSVSKEPTLTEIIGRSPDRADALVIAVYCRDFASRKARAGAAT